MPCSQNMDKTNHDDPDHLVYPLSQTQVDGEL